MPKPLKPKKQEVEKEEKPRPSWIEALKERVSEAIEPHDPEPVETPPERPSVKPVEAPQAVVAELIRLKPSSGHYLVCECLGSPKDVAPGFRLTKGSSVLWTCINGHRNMTEVGVRQERLP